MCGSRINEILYTLGGARLRPAAIRPHFLPATAFLSFLLFVLNWSLSLATQTGSKPGCMALVRGNNG